MNKTELVTDTKIRTEITKPAPEKPPAKPAK